MDVLSQLIIGAGPAGLAVAGRLRKAQLPFEILEAQSTVAPAWHNHYDRLHLHTVKQLSALPHLAFPEDYPTYVPRQLLADYYVNYAEHFDIRPHFNTKVKSIEKSGDHWLVHTNDDRQFRVSNVIVATGVNRVVHRPTWPGEADFQGQIIHSRAYKNAEPFKNQRVLVIGMGNTGAEIALDLAEQGVETYLSVRGPVNVVPRDFAGRPTQLTAIKLSGLPDWLNDWMGVQVRRLSFGNLSKYGIETPAISPTKQLRVLGKTPVIDLGTIAMIKKGKIAVKGDIERFNSTEVQLKSGEDLAVDSIILATGYRAKVEDFLPAAKAHFDAHQLPKQIIGSGELAGIYFIGFDNYRPGGILGIIYQDSGTIVEDIKKKASHPLPY